MYACVLCVKHHTALKKPCTYICDCHLEGILKTINYFGMPTEALQS